MIPEEAIAAAVVGAGLVEGSRNYDQAMWAIEAAAPYILAHAFEELEEIQAQPKSSLAEQIQEITRSKGGPFEGGLMWDECQWLASMLVASGFEKRAPAAAWEDGYSLGYGDGQVNAEPTRVNPHNNSQSTERHDD